MASGALHPTGRSRRGWRARLLLVLPAFGLAAHVLSGSLLRAADDVRPFWMSRASLESSDGVQRAIGAAVTSGLNTILVPVALGPVVLRGFDGVAEAVEEGGARGLRVYAWIDVSRAAGADELPGSRDHVLYSHPEWLMVPRELALEMLRVDLRSPEYVGRLARWTRAHADRTDALHVSPVHADAVTYLADRVAGVLGRYVVQGVHLGTLRFPDIDFDYSRGALDVFRTEVRSALTASERARMDTVEAIDPFAYPEEFPDEWRRFRQTRLTTLVTRLRTVIRAARPDVLVSAGVVQDAALALRNHMQDWRTWLDTRVVDALLEAPSLGLAPGRRPTAAGSQ